MLVNLLYYDYMWASALITFRETLEIALVVGILLSFLQKSNYQSAKRYVWIGLGGGVVFSLVLGLGMNIFIGEFEGKAEKLFEGVLLFITAGFLSWMILWVHRQKGVAKKLEAKASEHLEKGFPFGLLFLTFSTVVREGVETVFYLRAVTMISGGFQLIGAVLGIVLAILLSIAMVYMSIKINLQKFFKISGALLLLFSAGLTSHGVHEFQEAGILPLFRIDPVINLSFILDHHSLLGSMLNIFFGYTATPTTLQLLSYGSYVFLIFLLEVFTDRMLFLKSTKILGR